jgi:hypothetical protein
MGIDYADIAVPNGAVSLQFTFLWVDEDTVVGNEYVESLDRRGSAILGCNGWLLAFQYQPALRNLGAHIRGMSGLRQGILVLAPHNVSHFGQVGTQQGDCRWWEPRWMTLVPTILKSLPTTSG